MLQNDIWEVYRDEGVVVLALNVSSSSILPAQEWQRTHGLTHLVGWDENNVAWDLYGGVSVPFNVIIGQKLQILYSASGVNTDEYPPIIEAELNKTPGPPINLEVTGQFATSLALSWDKNQEWDVSGYELSIETAKASVDVIDVGPATDYVLTDLELNTTYNIWARAYDYRGNYSAASQSIKTETVGVVPTLHSVTIIILVLLGSVFISRSRRGSLPKNTLS